jgi:3-oxoacyl-[acyl-carrier-protein] synthase-3
MANPVITVTGYNVPDRVVTNDALTEYYDTSDEWIYERSGIKERRWINEGEECGVSDLSIPAVHQALEDAGLRKEDIDMMIFATLSPDAHFPGSGAFLQAKLQLDPIPCLDIRMQCSGFIYALSIAEAYIKNDMYKNILVVGAEVQSTGLDRTNDGRTVGVLFGDGAGVAVVSAKSDTEADGRGVLSTHLHTQGEFADRLWNPEPTSNRRPRITPGGKGIYPHMEGREVFKHAVTRMSESINEALKPHGWQFDDVSLYIPHQANYRITQTVAQQLQQPREKFYSNIHKYGNTTAASIPIALAEAQREGAINRGEKLVLTAFGSGFTWASAAIVF